MAARYYKCPKTGNKLPSVTTISGVLDKPALLYWAVNCACNYILENLSTDPFCPYKAEEIYPIVESARKNFRKVSATALDIGSAVHEAIERYLKTGKEPQAPSNEVLSAFLAFLEWLDTWKSWETVTTEMTVYSDRYAGTCDWVVILNGKKYLVDFKTHNDESKAKLPYEEVRFQTAAYRATDDSIQGNGVLYLGKTKGLPKWFDLSDTYEQDLKVFNLLTELWYARRGE